MSGIPCQIIIRAIVRFQSVPTGPTDLAAFDAQMRQCLSNDTIAQSIVNDTESGEEVCEILEKTTWSNTDRTTLWNLLKSIYGSYS